MSTTRHAVEAYVPGLRAVRTYERSWLSADVVAGLVLAAILVPQGMAYAELAGLPPVTGLYTTVACLIGYAVFGPSRVLVLGPDSSISPLILAAITPLLVGSDPAAAIALAGMLAIMVGLIEVGLGLGRLGFVADLLSTEVQVGYMNGLGITIIVGQLPKLFGFSTDADSFFEELNAFVSGLDETDATTLIVGLCVLVVLLVLPHFTKRVPAVLVAVVGATLVSAVLDLAADGVTTVGALPQGVPSPELPWTQASDLGPLLVAALGITLVSLTDTIATATSFAARRGDEVEPNQEMIGMGAANITAGLFQGFAVSTSGSRTAVAEQSGARSQLTGVVGAGLVVVLLLFLNSLLADLPQTALAAVVISAALSLMDLGILRRYFQVRKSALALSLVATAGVVVFGVLQGIVVAIVLAILMFFRRNWWPHGAVLGQVPGLRGWHGVDGHDDAVQIPGVVVYRWEAPLFFANAGAFRQQVRHLARDRAALVDRPAVRGDHRHRRDRGGHAPPAGRRAQRPGDPPRLRRAAQSAAGAGPPLRADGDAGPRPLLPDPHHGAGQGPRRRHRAPERGGTMNDAEPDTAIAPRRRAAALGALLAGTAALVTAVVGLRGDLGRAVLAGIAVLLVVALVWTTTTRRGTARRAAGVGLLVAIALLLVTVLTAEGHGLLVIVVLALLAGSAAFSRYALRRDRTTLQAAPTPGAPVGPAVRGALIMNLKSGGGKAERFHLEDEARSRGIEAIVLRPGDDLLQLARDAIERGADVVGMAGGDGSQALVASVAMQADVPLVCIPAGTRNHFALDLGLDRDDVVGALDAFGAAVERRIDLASVGDRVFVNNVSLGVYAKIVQSEEYRDAKRQTTAKLLPDLLGPDADPFDLRFSGPDGTEPHRRPDHPGVEQPLRPDPARRLRHPRPARHRPAGRHDRRGAQRGGGGPTRGRGGRRADPAVPRCPRMGDAGVRGRQRQPHRSRRRRRGPPPRPAPALPIDARRAAGPHPDERARAVPRRPRPPILELERGRPPASRRRQGHTDRRRPALTVAQSGFGRPPNRRAPRGRTSIAGPDSARSSRCSWWEYHSP